MVVTDYAMPGMNGGQLAALIQKMDSPVGLL